jgi:polysaccharide pyruvyl transferase WcaK-like protein
MKKILISAFIGSENLGDEAIFKSISQKLSKNKNLEISAFTLGHKNTSDNGIRMIKTYNPFKIINEIKNCDLLLCGGGGLIHDKVNIYNILRHTYKIIIARFLGTNYMFYAVGVDEVMSSFNKALTRFLCENALAISVRDMQSKRNLLKLGVSKPIVVTSDPVINLTIGRKEVKIGFQKPYIVVCLRHWFDINRYLPVAVVRSLNVQSSEYKEKFGNFLNQMTEFLDYIVDKHDVSLVFLPFFNGRDQKVHQQIIDRMRNKNKSMNITRKIKIDEADKIINKAEMLIGMRLHSQILSAKNYVPFLSLIYLDKVYGFLEELGFAQWGIDVNKLDKDVLIKKFEMIYSKKDIFKQELKKRVSALKIKEQTNYKILNELIKTLN